jgi:twitching motility protein PilU
MAAEAPAASQVPVVLVADDELEIRELVTEVLSVAGFAPMVASDGHEAIELARAKRPAVILLDVMMPGMDGYTVLTHLRGQAATRDIPVVILTGQGDVYRELSAGVGADAHVAKPFTPKQLADTVQRVLAARTAAATPEPGAPGAARAEAGPAPAAVEGDPTGVAQVYAILLAALREGATEIHVEPQVQQIRIRNRVGGRLLERGRLPRASLEAIVGRFRVLGAVGDDDPPIQAYVRTRLESQEIELELEFLASPHGESVIVRLWQQGLIEAEPILRETIARNASDIYLLEGQPPTLKVDGVATPLPDAPPLLAADLRKLVRHLMPEASRKTFEATNEADLSFVHPQFGRFRLNAYRAMGATGMVLRRVKTELPTFESLDLPPILGKLVMERQGLILLVGATGAGKSTTCAAMLDHRNTHAAGHIVTIEDPVEFIHPRKKSVISQREVGVDTGSYLVALHKALRQAPDVIFVGELRDKDTVSIALHSAETGHLVLSTLHATNATATLERLLNFFPSEAREATLMQISLLLRAVIAQRLVPRAGGTGRIAATEILINTPRIQALIRRGEMESIRQAIEEGVNEGLQTIDQSLLALLQQKKISQEDALHFADSPNNLRLRIKGIK